MAGFTPIEANLSGTTDLSSFASADTRSATGLKKFGNVIISNGGIGWIGTAALIGMTIYILWRK